jgi:formylglycine-generating enzyme required for sulfatase activity
MLAGFAGVSSDADAKYGGSNLMTLAEERIQLFTDRYGDAARDFAAYSAFPLALTTELCYCLRQEFARDSSWWVAPEILVSDLCEQVRHDLYVMSPEVRLELLTQLVDEGGLGQLNAVADFMGDYLRSAIATSSDFPTQAIGGSGNLVKYYALCSLRPEAVSTQEIKMELTRILTEIEASGRDPRERFELARVLTKQGDFLRQFGLETPRWQDLQAWAKAINNNESLDEIDLNGELGEQEPPKDAFATGDALDEFGFETPIVNAQGRMIGQTNSTAQAFREPLGEDLGLEMVAIPSGEFTMGSPASEEGRWDDEGPEHVVQVPPFFMGKFTVNQAQWRFVAGLEPVNSAIKITVNPSRFKGDLRPVERVSWEQSQEFCQRLSVFTKRTYRLPSEAEWEYACRAGAPWPFYFGKEITASLVNYSGSRNETNNVGELLGNGFGLYDMHGDVWEWCEDLWHDDYEGAPQDGSSWMISNSKYHVMRGGSWCLYPRYCRSATRDYDYIDDRDYDIGFRVVCKTSRA